MNKRGRPKKVTAEILVRDIEPYLRSTAVPILAEFAHQHGITRSYLYQLAYAERDAGRPELSNGLAWLSEAKEVALEKGGLTGKLNPSVVKFSLKQLGWREEPIDKNEGGGILINDDFTD